MLATGQEFRTRVYKLDVKKKVFELRVKVRLSPPPQKKIVFVVVGLAVGFDVGLAKKNAVQMRCGPRCCSKRLAVAASLRAKIPPSRPPNPTQTS